MHRCKRFFAGIVMLAIFGSTLFGAQAEMSMVSDDGRLFVEQIEFFMRKNKIATSEHVGDDRVKLDAHNIANQLIGISQDIGTFDRSIRFAADSMSQKIARFVRYVEPLLGLAGESMLLHNTFTLAFDTLYSILQQPVGVNENDLRNVKSYLRPDVLKNLYGVAKRFEALQMLKVMKRYVQTYPESSTVISDAFLGSMRDTILAIFGDIPVVALAHNTGLDTASGEEKGT